MYGQCSLIRGRIEIEQDPSLEGVPAGILSNTALTFGIQFYSLASRLQVDGFLGDLVKGSDDSSVRLETTLGHDQLRELC